MLMHYYWSDCGNKHTKQWPNFQLTIALNTNLNPPCFLETDCFFSYWFPRKQYFIGCRVQVFYSRTNWPPFTGGQNSILNWVLKLNPLNQKIKSNKSCLDCLEIALFILFFFFFFLPLGVISSVKSIQKEKLQSRKWNMCDRKTSFSAIFHLNKIMVPISQIIHLQKKTLNPCVNRALEQRHMVQTYLPSLFTFWH